MANAVGRSRHGASMARGSARHRPAQRGPRAPRRPDTALTISPPGEHRTLRVGHRKPSPGTAQPPRRRPAQAGRRTDSSVARYTRTLSSGETRGEGKRSSRTDQSAAASPASSANSLAAVSGRILPLHVQQAGRQLVQPAAHRVPVLLDDRQPPLGVQRHNGHRTGMLDDLSYRDTTAGHFHLIDPQRKHPAWVERTTAAHRKVVPGHRDTPARSAGSSTGSRTAAR